MKYGLLHPHLVEAAGLNGGKVGDAVLLEATGTGALLDHGVLNDSSGEKREQTDQQGGKRKNQKRVLETHMYKYPHPRTKRSHPQYLASSACQQP